MATPRTGSPTRSTCRGARSVRCSRSSRTTRRSARHAQAARRTRRRTMADRRFTDVELERSLAGDLSPARAAALAAEATPADKARLAELERDQAEYLRGIDIDAEVRRIEQRAERFKPEVRRPWWLRYLLPIGTLAAAAAAL